MAFHIIRKLQKLGVIQGTKLVFNMALLGYSYSVILFNVTGHSDSLQKEIKEFCNKHPFVNSLGLSINKPNGFIQIFHKTNEELRDTIQDLKNLLSKNYVEYKILNVLEEEQINTFPLFS
jgi:DNA-binding Lrp family transcriptional regulator